MRNPLHWLCFRTVTKKVEPTYDPKTNTHTDGKLAMSSWITDKDGNVRPAKCRITNVKHTQTYVRWGF